MIVCFLEWFMLLRNKSSFKFLQERRSTHQQYACTFLKMWWNADVKDNLSPFILGSHCIVCCFVIGISFASPFLKQFLPHFWGLTMCLETSVHILVKPWVLDNNLHIRDITLSSTTLDSSVQSMMISPFGLLHQWIRLCFCPLLLSHPHPNVIILRWESSFENLYSNFENFLSGRKFSKFPILLMMFLVVLKSLLILEHAAAAVEINRESRYWVVQRC